LNDASNGTTGGLSLTRLVSQPSKRFAIVAPLFNSTSIQPARISPAAKHLLAKEMDRVCDCFLSALAGDLDGYSKISTLISKWIQPPYDDNEDAEFSSKASKRLAQGLCAWSERFPTIQAFVGENTDLLLFTFLGSLTSSSRLESFPSRNLERIREKAGEKGMEQSIALLDLLNDDSLQQNSEGPGNALRLGRIQRKRKRKATEIWDFCRQLGSVLSRVVGAPDSVPFAKLGRDLLDLDIDRSTVISLEDETMNIFRLIRRILSSAANEDVDFAVFERVSSFLLFAIGNQTLLVLQSLKYHDQASCRTSANKGQDFKHSRLYELLSAFVELLVATLTWIIRENPLQVSESWSCIQRKLRDNFLSPVLRRQGVNLSITLQDLVVSTKRFLVNPRAPQPVARGTALVDCDRYLRPDSIFFALVRRSQQLMIATARNTQFVSVPHALLEAATSSSEDVGIANNVSLIVGSSFPTGRTPTSIAWGMYHSPLEELIDVYLASVEDQHFGASDDVWIESMSKMKKDFLSNLVVPGLNRVSTTLPKKQRLLYLLKYSLECEIAASIRATTTTTTQSLHEESTMKRLLDVDMACSTIKALTSNMYQCLEQTCAVDGTMVAAIFDCSMYLAGAPILPTGRSSEMTRATATSLLGWGREAVAGIGAPPRTMIGLSKTEIDACYVWIFFNWLHCVASLVATAAHPTAAGEGDDLSKVRAEWHEYRGCRAGSTNEEPLLLDDPTMGLDHWDRLLADFEQLLFPPTGSDRYGVVKNVYAREKERPALPNLQHEQQQPGTGGSRVEAWIPTSAVRRSAKEYMAVVVSMT
jgi:hypothetical protein